MGHERMRILIAPDSFKECLSATYAAHIIADACEEVAQERSLDLDLDLIPFSDGGEGLLDTLLERYDADIHLHNVQGPSGAPVEARWGVLHDDPGWLATNPLLAAGKALLGSVLVPDLFEGSTLEHHKIGAIESAEAIGLHLVPPHKRNPLKSSSTGLGELIKRALDMNTGRIWIGLGGSSTVDGGIGALHELGARFKDSEGNPVPSRSNRAVGEDLFDIRTVDLSELDHRLEETRITLLCDVENPLLGEHGAARTYAPQKGATPEQVVRLERGLENLAGAFEREYIEINPDEPMMGAAGGLAFGLAAALDARMVPGADFLIEQHDIAMRLEGADLLILAEGRLDSTSFSGKAVGTLSGMARSAGVATMVIAGQGDRDTILEALDRGILVQTLIDSPEHTAHSIEHAPQLIRERAVEALRAFL
ncbi:MAG: glycerate kinase [Phycisphaerales bacterium JB043]